VNARVDRSKLYLLNRIGVIETVLANFVNVLRLIDSFFHVS